MNVGEIDVVDENGWKCMKVDEIRRKFMKVDDHLVTIWWQFVDHLVTTWWPLVDHLMTTFDYLVTISWPLYQLFFSSSSVLHSVTTWWLLSTFVQFLFFAPVSTAHPPAFGAYWYFRQFCHDIYFLKALSDMYTIKSKSREIYTIFDITIWWYYHDYYHNYPCNHHYNHRNFLRSSAQNIFFMSKKRGPSCIGGRGV